MTNKSHNLIDMTGQTFGRLTIIARAKQNIDHKATWLCLCACGNEIIACGRDIRRGDTRSCGCLFDEMMAHRNGKHAGKGTRLYSIWKGMRERVRSSPKYAGRVLLDPVWHTFPPFRKWALANGYRDDLMIDRKNTFGHYTPDNCRWATAKQQSENRYNRRGGYTPAL